MSINCIGVSLRYVDQWYPTPSPWRGTRLQPIGDQATQAAGEHMSARSCIYASGTRAIPSHHLQSAELEKLGTIDVDHVSQIKNNLLYQASKTKITDFSQWYFLNYEILFQLPCAFCLCN